VPYFEAVVLARKGLLTYVTSPGRVVLWSNSTQAWSSLSINLLYAALLTSKPMRFFPSSTVKGFNLYQLAEVLSTVVTVMGNLLALFGVYSTSSAMEPIGIVFGVGNLFFTVVFLAWYQVDIKKGKEKLKRTAKGLSSIEAMEKGPIQKSAKKITVSNKASREFLDRRMRPPPDDRRDPLRFLNRLQRDSQELEEARGGVQGSRGHGGKTEEQQTQQFLQHVSGRYTGHEEGGGE